jgi:hypothetical protein
MFDRVHRPLCMLPRCKTSRPSCILRNASEPRSPLCRLVPATLVGPLWPSGGLLVQGTKLACLTRVTTARPHSFSFALPPHWPSCSALLARPPAPLSSLAFAVGGGLRLPLGVRRYPIFCAAVPNPLFSALVPPLWLFLVRLCRVNCSAILAFCRVVIHREHGTRFGVFVLFGLFAARSRFILRKC